MRADSTPFSDTEHAYELLGVPASASALVIKHAYRAMAKRWHPDLYRASTPEQAEAARMMELINEAYSTIKSAPLRYSTPGNYGAASQPTSQTTRPANHIPTMSDRKPFVAPDKLEFWIRFVCGSILGMFVSASLILRTWYWLQPSLVQVLCIPSLSFWLAGLERHEGEMNFGTTFSGSTDKFP